MNKLLSTYLLIGIFFTSSLLSAQSDEVTQLPDCSFKFSVATSARKSTIWGLWTDVENWKKYDTILEYSYLVSDSAFEVGAIGYVKADGVPRTKFELIEVNESVSFIERLKLPLFHAIELQRYFEVNNSGSTTFTHEVNFKGPLRYLIYALAGPTFRRELPLVMGRLKDLAESEEQQETDINFPSTN